MKVKFNTAVVFGTPNLSFSQNQIVEIDEKLVKGYIENGTVTVIEEAVEAIEEKPKKVKATKNKGKSAE